MTIANIMAEKDASKMTPLELIQAAKDFSFEQKLNVVQSVLQLIPRERQQPWNFSKSSWDKYQLQEKKSKPREEGNADNVDGDSYNIAASVFAEDKTTELKQPPLLDPYEKSMRYYEKNLILNKFQHMTAKLVLHRPDDALQYMIDWCKEAQLQSKAEATKIKMLYDDEDGAESSDEKEPEKVTIPKRHDNEIPESFGNELTLRSMHTGDDIPDKEIKPEPKLERGQGDQPQPSSDDRLSSRRESELLTTLEPKIENTVQSDEAEVSVSEADETEETISALSSENGSDIENS